MASHGARGALFQEQAALYAAHRPTYPPELFESIWRFTGGSATGPPAASRTLAVDVACGTGQACVELAAVYDRVIATDSSAGQLEHAAQRPNIEYRLCPAERLGDVVAPGSADLITVGQALHWFDAGKFYVVARRALCPSGTLAIWGYTLSSFVPGHPAQTPAALDEANALLQRWCYDPPLGPCWDPGRKLLDAKYVGLEPTAEQFGHVERLDVPGMEKVTSLDACIGYLSSFSNYTTFRRQQPGADDPLEALRRQLRRLLVAPTHGDDAAPVLRQQWPLFLLLARDPVPLPQLSGRCM